ncbi:MAG TPA: EmrA/EmrK family multidrug efflux transporter periplasmic adaptor subunit [Rhodanobacteraceae bacterium]|jgi:membrane fusion protein (multidrug efflux system)|nr:EmrA/EmrK family multidrug efflux transporter periplasmic adaptor subunit [Rhodanobacteraceae bacterium]
MTSPIIPNPADDNDPAARLKEQRLKKRRVLLRGLVGVVIVVAIAWVLYYLFVGRWYESTDDAYVNGNIVQITPQVPGTVISIGADDNDFVREGQPLVKLDPTNTDVALEKAEATLAQTVRKVRGLYSTVHSATAAVAAREAAVAQARADFQRRKGLAASGAISAEELAHARDALTTAESALSAAQAQLATTSALVSDTKIASHPDVKAAAAAVRAAWLNDQRTTLVAPVSGYVAKRSVQVGQRVQPGMPLMAVVPLHQVWVDANFKETQLEHMRIGQPVTLTSDVYGGSVTYHGHVEGLGIGTGSAFSLLPAQNASGNWIKIVQRLPVRISLEKSELDKHPLRIGLSMNVDVNLHSQKGPMLAQQPPQKAVFSTDVYTRSQADADALIAKIIHANSGAAVDSTHGAVARGH